MAVLDKNIKDKSAFDFNPITGRLDLVRKFNPDRIVTNMYNAAGTQMVTYDMASGRYIAMDPVVVTDNDGNVVVVGT